MANNTYLDTFDSEKPSSFIFSADANSLYGWGQSQFLPVGGFTWLNYDEIKNLDNASIDDHSSVGYILEVDLHYPYYLHDDHADYPLAPEKINVPIEILSPYSQSLAKS